MPVTVETMARWCRTLLGAEPSASQITLDDYLRTIPRLDSLDDVPSGTPVLVRGDLDAKPGNTVGEGDVRLRSMVETLAHGRRRGWKQIIFGHVGRKPEGSLVAVGKRLSELLAYDVPLVTDWLDEGSLTIPTDVTRTIADAAPGTVLLLENTRRYAIERVLWKATPDDVKGLAGRLAQLANECAEKLAKVYVNEALSAGSLDSSTTIVPAAMDRVAMGRYVAGEFDGPMRRCLATRLVVFSGLKSDKLDDLEAMIGRGTIGWVFTAGSLAMALKKASSQLDGIEFHMGVAEDPTPPGQTLLHRSQPHRSGPPNAPSGSRKKNPLRAPLRLRARGRPRRRIDRPGPSAIRRGTQDQRPCSSGRLAVSLTKRAVRGPDGRRWLSTMAYSGCSKTPGSKKGRGVSWHS